MQDYIFEYIRDRKGLKIGIIASTVHNGMIVTGFSKTNIKAGDKFNKGIGIDWAIERAKGNKRTPQIPKSDIRQFREVQVRALRYFKQANSLSVLGTYLPDYQQDVKQDVKQELDPIKQLQRFESYLKIINRMSPEKQKLFQTFAKSILNRMR